MTKMRTALIHQAIRMSWGPDTAMGEWDSCNPALNQCAVTALIVQDYFGGELLRCPMSDGDSHYWNRTADGEVDLTASQFKHIEPQPLKSETAVRDRDYVLSFPDTARRYRILQRRVDNMIASLQLADWDRG